MFLIARPKKQAQILQQLLKDSGICAEYLPLMEIIPDADNLVFAAGKLLHADAVLPVSPSVIDLLDNYWQNLPESAQVFCVGRSSGELLAKKLSNRIMFPKNGAGINALIGEEILLSGKIGYLMVIGGDEINPLLADYLLSCGISHEYISLYHRENYGLSHLAEIKRLICNSSVEGIIITSRLIAKYLVECCDASDILQKKIGQLDLISLHPQITSYLKEQGLTGIYQTVDSSNHSIVEMLKSITKK